MKLDPDLEGLAILALKNAFYREFSALVNKYEAAAEEFGQDRWDMDLGATANVASTDDDTPFTPVKVRVRISGHILSSAEYTLRQALLNPNRGEKIMLEGKDVFMRGKSGWVWVGS